MMMDATFPSPVGTARLAGLFYALNIATILAAVALLAGAGAGVGPDGVARLAAHAVRLRAAVVAETLSTAFSVAVAGLLYVLFRSADPAVSFATSAFRLIACAIAIAGYALQTVPLQLVGDASAMQPSLLALSRLHGALASFVIVLFGFHYLGLGYLILKSGLLPRALGWLALAAGVAGLGFLDQPTGHALQVALLPLGLAAEVSIALGLLTSGWRHGRNPPEPEARHDRQQGPRPATSAPRRAAVSDLAPFPPGPKPAA